MKVLVWERVSVDFNGVLTFTCSQEETPNECTQRVQENQKRLKELEQRERARLAQLKAKYE